MIFNVSPSQAMTRLLAIAFMVAALSGCAGVAIDPIPTGTGPDRAPSLSRAELMQLSQLPDPQVVALQPSATGNRPEYEVWGKTYSVMPSAQGYQTEGVASWYGAKFHGRRTSSGEVYDMYQLTAAHRSLPIPVFARVTNLQNGRSTIVKINDRGPFHAERVIDLSFAAAVKLDFHHAGTAPVRIEVLDPSGLEPQPQDAEQPYYLHAGQFSSEAQARRALGRLVSLGNSSVQIIARDRGGFSLRIGPISSKSRFNRLQALLIALDIGLPTLVPGR